LARSDLDRIDAGKASITAAVFVARPPMNIVKNVDHKASSTSDDKADFVPVAGTGIV
jgi:hypothetical protein